MRYGYKAYTFQIHKYGRPQSPLVLGELDGSHDAAVLLYGALRGVQQTPYRDRQRHVRIVSAAGAGRTVQFKNELGRSGLYSTFYRAGTDEPVFDRTPEHIESGVFRGLLVAPTRSKTGMLVTEVQGRSGAKTVLVPAIKNVIRHHTGLIVDFSAVVDEDALERFLSEAAIKDVTLRRTGIPNDMAEAAEFPESFRERGKLELHITPGGPVKQLGEWIYKLRDDPSARRRLLQVGAFDFNDLSIGMEVGSRQTTLTVTADKIPSFVYDLPGPGRPDDDAFYSEVLSSVEEMARALGIPVGASWQSGEWSSDALSTLLTAPWRDGADDAAVVG